MRRFIMQRADAAIAAFIVGLSLLSLAAVFLIPH
jgi:hypothetical protein